MQVLYSNALPRRLCFIGVIIFKLLLKTNMKELGDGLFNKLGVCSNTIIPIYLRNLSINHLITLNC